MFRTATLSSSNSSATAFHRYVLGSADLRLANGQETPVTARHNQFALCTFTSVANVVANRPVESPRTRNHHQRPEQLRGSPESGVTHERRAPSKDTYLKDHNRHPAKRNKPQRTSQQGRIPMTLGLGPGETSYSVE